MASRSENIDKIIKNNYGKKIIIIDRFVDSTIAYQHYGMGISLDLINNLNNFLLDRFIPTFTFLSIVNKKNMKIRLNKRFSLNKYDKFDLSFYNKVQEGFLKISKDKKNYFIIDSNENNIEENSKIIIKKIKKLVS
tara:strand:- start:1730 stop:2137 length:408 start_codon:yes stop_codon:yes gene_type:complete